MAENNNGNGNQKEIKYVGKVKEMNGSYGSFEKIFMENNNPTNQDGSDNQYYAGTLVFVAKDGRQFKVKQLALTVPKNGMRQDQAQRGFTKTVTIDLTDSYMVEPIE